MLLLIMFMHQLQRATSAANAILHDKLKRFYHSFLTSKLLYDCKVDMAMWFHLCAWVQYSTVQYGTVQYDTVQYSTVQYSTVQYGTVRYSTVQYSTVQYSTVRYSREE